MTIAATASEAFERYRAAYKSGLLIQGKWRDTAADGRFLACGLGVLGDEIKSTGDCPAQVMPQWLARMVPWFFDNQEANDAKLWGFEFYGELKRLNGRVPFSVVHDWHATSTTPLVILVAEKSKHDTAPHVALQAMHKRALTGDLATKYEWAETLKSAYARADVYFDADADANVYVEVDAANAKDKSNTNANAYAYAYAYTYIYAKANTNADAKKKDIIKLYADGMVECLRRVSTPQVAS
jgi:hypothetical protein